MRTACLAYVHHDAQGYLDIVLDCRMIAEAEDNLVLDTSVDMQLAIADGACGDGDADEACGKPPRFRQSKKRPCEEAEPKRKARPKPKPKPKEKPMPALEPKPKEKPMPALEPKAKKPMPALEPKAKKPMPALEPKPKKSMPALEPPKVEPMPPVDAYSVLDPSVVEPGPSSRRPSKKSNEEVVDPMKKKKKQQKKKMKKKKKKHTKMDGKPQKRDRCKTKKFNEIWESLSAEAKEEWSQLPTRAK